jgi:hypothetical protein
VNLKRELVKKCLTNLLRHQISTTICPKATSGPFRAVPVSNIDVSSGRTLSLIRWLFAITASILLALVIAILSSDWNNRRQAEAMLTLARTIQVGESTVADVMQAAEMLRENLDVRKGVDQSHFPTETVPISACASVDCVLFFHLSRWDKPAALVDLQLEHPRLRKKLPLNTLMLTVSTSTGIVQTVQAFAETVDDQTASEATTTITNDRHASPWRIERRGRVMEGQINAGMSAVEIHATSAADHARKARAFDFNLSCLRITRHCSACELLPFACQDH